MKNVCCASLVLVVAICLAVTVASSQGVGFANPILAGFYPDPSICKAGDEYYLTNSTFAYFPGLPVFRSKDLVNWKLIGHVLDRAEQLNLDKQGVSRGLFAPAIRYHAGLFYVTCTLVDIGGNFVVTANNPAGPWSNPVWIPEINGIDPSLFFDANGKSYIIYNSIAPENKPQYDGHRTIRMYEFDVRTLTVKGEELLLVNGGVDLATKPIWIEAPHIFLKNGYYYLFCAEGGTADQHSEVVFRSKNVEGPYLPYENNPILTQRHLNRMRENPITSTGHADFVETDTGEWWAVFLGCRPYPPVDQDYYNTGRETFLAPVKWTDGWPVINPDNDFVQYQYPYPIQPLAPTGYAYGGNFKLRDDFSDDTLDANWVFLRTPHEKWYDLKSTAGWLTMKLRAESASGDMNPSFLGHRQQHLTGSATVALDFNAATENEKAGILIFHNEKHFYLLCKSVAGNGPQIQLYKSGENDCELLASRSINDNQAKDKLFLKVDASTDTYSFSYAFDNGEWTTLKDSVDAKFLSTRIARGFVGCIYALYATSSGKPSTNTARFDWFEYVGDDKVFR